MAEKKADQLRKMLTQPQRPPQPAQEIVQAPGEAVALVRGQPYQTGPQNTPIVLPAEADALSVPMQDIARRYLGARRKSGEALLEAARWLSEARNEAQHGEWLRFLDVTSTTPDAAERLLNIHQRAMSDAQFAEAVRTNWLSPTTAALLARPSTPTELVAEVLQTPSAPKLADIEQKIKQARQPKPDGQIPQNAVFGDTLQPKPDGQIPQNAVFGDALQPKPDGQIPQNAVFGDALQPKSDGQIPQNAVFDQASTSGQQIFALEMLRETVKALVHLERTVGELPATTETEQALERAEHAIAALRRALRARG